MWSGNFINGMTGGMDNLKNESEKQKCPNSPTQTNIKTDPLKNINLKHLRIIQWPL